MVVENNHGYNSPLSTVLGRTTDAGLARTWSTRRDGAASARSRGPPTRSRHLGADVSLANGLLYAYTKRHSWWGANAWYLTAIDVRNGRRCSRSAPASARSWTTTTPRSRIAQDGSAYVATLGGMVRVRDRD